MRLNDFAMIFLIIFFSFNKNYDLKAGVLYNDMQSEIIINNIMDNIVMDVLDSSMKTEGADKNTILKNMDFEMKYMINKSISSDFLKMLIFIENDGYYVMTNNNNEFSEKIFFKEESIKDHSKKVQEIISYIEKEKEFICYMPTNYGETFKNTIGDNSLICIYTKVNFIIDGITYENYSVSGAVALKKEP